MESKQTCTDTHVWKDSHGCNNGMWQTQQTEWCFVHAFPFFKWMILLFEIEIDKATTTMLPCGDCKTNSGRQWKICATAFKQTFRTGCLPSEPTCVSLCGVNLTLKSKVLVVASHWAKVMSVSSVVLQMQQRDLMQKTQPKHHWLWCLHRWAQWSKRVTTAVLLVWQQKDWQRKTKKLVQIHFVFGKWWGW